MPISARRFHFCNLLLLLVLCVATAASPKAPANSLANRVGAALAAHTPDNATVTVQIVALEPSRRVLYARSPDRAMIPASNLKLLTTAAALDELGPDFKFRTLLLAREGEAGVELAVIGDGDPSFGDASLARAGTGWGTRSTFQGWANLLREQGISHVTALYLDDSVLDDQHIHDAWPVNQRHQRYVAQVGGLNLNINCLDVYLTRTGGAGSILSPRIDPPTSYVELRNTCRAGDRDAVILTRAEGNNIILLSGQTNARAQGPMQVTVDNPTGYFGAVLSEVLRETGVSCEAPQVDRTVRRAWEAQQRGEISTDDPEAWRVIAIHQTPIQTVLDRTNKDSVNLYAEALAKRLAFAATEEPGSWATANEAVRKYVGRIGSQAQQVRLDDGSGLSRQNRASAAALCDVLVDRHHSDSAEMFRESLSEAGVDGTLQRRFAGSDRSDLQGRVFAKTGYINGVSAFSGYLHGRDGRWYAFSILVNDIPGGQVWKAKLLQEEIVLALDRTLPRNAAAGSR